MIRQLQLDEDFDVPVICRMSNKTFTNMIDHDLNCIYSYCKKGGYGLVKKAI